MSWTEATSILNAYSCSLSARHSSSYAPMIRASTIGSKGAKRLLIHLKYSGPGARKSIRAVSLRVGSRLWIFGIDPIPEMVAAARRAADRHGLKNAKFGVALADHLCRFQPAHLMLQSVGSV